MNRRVRGACLALTVAVALTWLSVPTPAAAAAPRCGWLPTAIRLAHATADVTDPRAAGIRAQLAALGITADTDAGTPCPTDPDTTAADPTPPASAAPAAGAAVPPGGTTVCDKFGSTTVGEYEVQNNVWGSTEPACVRAFSTADAVGFEVTQAQFDNGDGPAAYPSVFTGCHYGTCTPNTALPERIPALAPIAMSWTFTIPAGDEQWGAAYDIWFAPTPQRDGTVTGTEMMIWLDHTGPAPLGAKTATADIGGRGWEIWTGDNGATVISYVAVEPTRSLTDLPLQPFIADAVQRGALGAEDYLTSIQAGFEPWTGGAGMTTTSFRVTGVTT